jgi:fibronectin-binding autotransporter adhesin
MEMLGRISCLRTTDRERLATRALAVAAIAVLTLLAASPARASGCTDSWTNNKGGSWFTAGNWSKGVPTSADEACITENGTYTVEMTQSSSTVSLKALTVGGTSGTQTLAVGSSVSLNAILTTTAGISNGAQGAITLTNGDAASNSVTLVGPISNAGTITTEVAHGGARNLQGAVTNTGTLQFNANTAYNGASNALTNEGALNVAESKALTVSNKSSITNGTGGKIAASGSGNVLIGSGTSFTEGAGTTSGTKPVIVDDAALVYTGAGASTIAVQGEGNTLSGNLSSGQSLSIESTVFEHAKETAAAGFTNAGSITLTNGDSSANNATLVISSGTLGNSGTITTQPASGGQRVLQGNLTNTGTLQVNANTTYNGKGALLNNEGAINLAEAKALTVSEKGSLINGVGGKIVATGSGTVLMESATSFAEGAGTTSGSKPVIVRDAALSYTGGGSSAIAIRGESGTLSGNVSSGQSLSIESTVVEHAKVTVGAGFTNAGSITLTNGDGASNNATLLISSGTLSNSGTITTLPANGGARTIQGNITNTGTLQINANTSDPATSPTLMNKGAIDIATGVSLAIPNKPAIANESGGTIAGSGSGALVQSGGTFNEGLGKTTGGEPVILNELALNYSDKGASTIALRGTSTLSGAINTPQTLSIQSTCSAHAVTSAAGFVSSGTINLTNGDGCGNNATLNLAGGTLENKGTINAEHPTGGNRTIEGSLKNEKTLSLSAGATLKVTGIFTQGHKATLKTAIAGTTSFGALAVSGAATLDGTLALAQSKTFFGKAGNSFAILSSSARTGSFAKAKSLAIKKAVGLYYKPTYSPTGVTLLVTQATLVLAPAEGLPGSSSTFSGAGYVPGDTLKLSFTDHKKVKTTLPNVTVNGSGEFSSEVTIPPGAVAGAAKVNVKSTETGLSITATFTVS